jgi:uncharacterized protein
VRQREAVGKAGWNPELIGKRQTIEDLNWNNDFKEIFLDGDSKVVLILSAPCAIPQDWFLTSDDDCGAIASTRKPAPSA